MYTSVVFIQEFLIWVRSEWRAESLLESPGPGETFSYPFHCHTKLGPMQLDVASEAGQAGVSRKCRSEFMESVLAELNYSLLPHSS